MIRRPRSSPLFPYTTLFRSGLHDPIVFAAAPNAVCIMWATFALLPAALDRMLTWGFQFKTGGPWIKHAGNGTPAMENRLCHAQRRRDFPHRRPGRAQNQEPLDPQ